MPEIIYCAGSSLRFASIAIDVGFLYGAQMPSKVYFPPYFCDQNWKKPNREKYMQALAIHRPHIATVLDLEHERQLNEVLDWAEEASQYAQVVMIIPKVQGIINSLPRVINGKEIRLGYSVPTSHGGSELPLWDFVGWPIHLLGGSPHRQMEICRYLQVNSVDGNLHNAMAVRHNKYWQNGKWIPLRSSGYVERDAPYEAFRRSCVNIMSAWMRDF